MKSTPRWLPILCLLPLLGWWITGLHDLDEGFYAAITSEMNRRGEWITPYYNGQPWFEKPILLYWIAKPCLWLFGDTWGPRIPSVLSAAAIYGLLYWFARRRLTPGAEVWAPLICGSSLLMVGASRMMLTDPLLVLCITAAVITYLEAIYERPQWLIATGVALGAGVLAKGPVAILLFLIPAGWAFFRAKPGRPSGPASLASFALGFVAMMAVIASWYVPCYLQNRDTFVQKFLIEQNLNRFTGGDTAHTIGPASLPYYFPILLLGFLPWSLYPRMMWRHRKDENGMRGILWAWAIGTFVFFTLSGAKLVHYVMPCIPPLSLLMADAVAQVNRAATGPTDRRFSLRLPVIATVVVAIIANSVFFWYYGSSGQAEAHELVRKVRDAGGSVAFYQLGRREKDLGTGSLRLRETSLPSLFLYLNANALDTDDLEKIRAAHPRWIFTRRNRLSDVEIAGLGGKIAVDGSSYRLIEIP